MELGLACHVCGHLNPIQGQVCGRCGTILAPEPVMPAAAQRAAAPAPAPAPQPVSAPPAAAPPPPRFDPVTGQRLSADPDRPAPKTMFFGALQQEDAVPRLVVIKGGGPDGATYHLQAATTVVGRLEGDIVFGQDPFLSPKHAKFTTQQGRLFVQDLDSQNGVFVRIKQPVPLAQDDAFLVGEELLRLDTRPFSGGRPSPAGTYFYGSPQPEGAFRVVQCLAGGADGRIASASGDALTIGREGNDLDFPTDRFISGHHARLDRHPDGRVVLTDTGSRNGTFVRISAATELVHGDYVFLGQQLLRVEIGHPPGSVA